MASAGGSSTNVITRQPPSRFSLQVDARPLQVELKAGSLPALEGAGGHWSMRRNRVDRYGWTPRIASTGDRRVECSAGAWNDPRVQGGESPAEGPQGQTGGGGGS